MSSSISSINFRRNLHVKPVKPPATVFLRNIPRGVKDQFKAYCARRGITMTDKVVELMREAIKKDNQLESR